MSDFEPTSTPVESPAKRRTRRIAIGAVAGLVLLIALVLIASKAGLDKAMVRQQLDAFASQLRERGKAQGRDIEFTYQDISIEGGFTDRHAVVRAPRLQVKPLNPQPNPDGKPQSLVISSEAMEIHPQGKTLSAFLLSLPHPLNFTTVEEPEKSLLKITGAEPFTLYYAQETVKNVPMLRWTTNLPKSMQLTYLHEQRAEGVEDATPTVTPVYDTLNITMEKASGEMSVQDDRSGLGQGMLEIKSVTIAPESAPAEGAITIDQVLSQWSNQRNAKNLNVVHSSFAIDNVQADSQLLPYAPISVAFDVTYEGSMPSTQEEQASIEANESAFKLKTFTIRTKDATFNATADFTATAEDKLPVGMANVTITNLPFIVGELKRYKLFDAQKEQLLSALLQQVTGTPYAELKDVVVDVNRARGGSFKIGKSTFEELFAVLLQASLSSNPAALPSPATAPVPTIPTEKKALPPVDVPEDTRG